MPMMDEARLMEKLRLIEALFAGAKTAGEKDAADRARQRILDRLQSMEASENPFHVARSISGLPAVSNLAFGSVSWEKVCVSPGDWRERLQSIASNYRSRGEAHPCGLRSRQEPEHRTGC